MKIRLALMAASVVGVCAAVPVYADEVTVEPGHVDKKVIIKKHDDGVSEKKVIIKKETDHD